MTTTNTTATTMSATTITVEEGKISFFTVEGLLVKEITGDVIDPLYEADYYDSLLTSSEEEVLQFLGSNYHEVRTSGEFVSQDDFFGWTRDRLEAALGEPSSLEVVEYDYDIAGVKSATFHRFGEKESYTIEL